MYYSLPCSYCGRVFYTYQSNREHAAEILYKSIKKHLIDYNEDDKEHHFDEHPDIEIDQAYHEVHESSSPPPGGYEVH
jgi:hypothetical protein